MSESRSTVPDFELRVDVDMTACVELRDRLRDAGTDPLPSTNDVIVKACATALREFPGINSAYEDGAVRRFARVNVGIAVAAPGSLLVPVVRDADRLSLGEIAPTSRAVATRARDGSATAADLSGATFTVSNLGMFGVDDFSAVVDAPQAAILAVGAIRRRADRRRGRHDRRTARRAAFARLRSPHRLRRATARSSSPACARFWKSHC